MERDLVEYIAKSLVDDPSAVSVSEKETDRGIVLELRVASGDVGKVIGNSDVAYGISRPERNPLFAGNS